MHKPTRTSRLGPRALVALGTLAFALMATPSIAQGIGFGVRAGVYSDASDAFIGGELVIPLKYRSWTFAPNVEAVFVDRGDLVTVNGDLQYNLDLDANVDVWFGGGPALLVRNFDRDRDDDEDTDFGFNLLAGVGFPAVQAFTPYFQVKAILADNSETVFAFGVRF